MITEIIAEIILTPQKPPLGAVQMRKCLFVIGMRVETLRLRTVTLPRLGLGWNRDWEQLQHVADKQP